MMIFKKRRAKLKKPFINDSTDNGENGTVDNTKAKSPYDRTDGIWTGFYFYDKITGKILGEF